MDAGFAYGFFFELSFRLGLPAGVRLPDPVASTRYFVCEVLSRAYFVFWVGKVMAAYLFAKGVFAKGVPTACAQHRRLSFRPISLQKNSSENEGYG